MPGQTIHVSVTQEISISMTVAAATEPARTQQLASKAVLGYTQVNGRFDAQGRMESTITIERIEAQGPLDKASERAATLEKAVGRSVTVAFDRNGKLVDVKVPEDLKEAAPTVRQLVGGANSAANFLPAIRIAVGETITTPSDMPMRLPGSTSKTPLKTRMLMTLRAIERRGQERLARLEQRIELAEETTQMKVGGGGPIEVNLDRGFVSASTTEWTFTGDYLADTSGSAPQPAKVTGTFKVTMTAN